LDAQKKQHSYYHSSHYEDLYPPFERQFIPSTKSKTKKTISSSLIRILFLFILLLSSVYFVYSVSTQQSFVGPMLPTTEPELGTLSLSLPASEISEVYLSRRSQKELARALRERSIPSEWISSIQSEFFAGNGKIFLVTPFGLSEVENITLRSYSEDGDVVIATWNGKLEVSLPPKQVIDVHQVFFGVIQKSFSATAQKSGMPQDAIDDLVDLFSDKINFSRDLRLGDRFTVIYRKPENGKEGAVLAAAFEVNDKDFVAIRYVGSDGKARYFDQTGNALGQNFLRYPLKFTKISSAFSDARFHPVLKRTRPHNGVDFSAPIGTPVRTVADGRIVFAGYRGTSGIMVKIRHDERFTTEYLHLKSIQPNLRKGTFVAQGQVIGEVGMTGITTGAHLHFGLFDRNKYVNPLTADLPLSKKLGRGQQISQTYLERVIFTLRHYQRVQLSSYTS